MDGFQRIFKQIKKEKINQIFENITYSSNGNEMEEEKNEREAHEESKRKYQKKQKDKESSNAELAHCW